MGGKFEVYKDKAGEFRFRLKADNGEIILVSAGYKQRVSAEKGVESVKKNSPLDERYERKETISGKPMFNLKASNGQVIGTSESYNSEAARDNGIETVKKNAPVAEIADQATNDREAEFEALGTTQERIEWSLDAAKGDTQAFLLSALGCLDNIIDSTKRKIPNHPDKRKPWEDEVDFLLTARSHIEKLESLVPRDGEDVNESHVDEVCSTLLEYKNHFSSWPKDHVKEVTDNVWRGGLIGIFTGVGLIFGVPAIGAMIGTALFGGEKIAKVVQRIVPGGGS